MNYKLKTEEQETTVHMMAGVKTATIYTCDRRMMAKMDRLCEERPDVYCCVWTDANILGDGLPMGKRYECASRVIRFTKPRIVTEEQREIARERFAHYKNADRV